MRQILPEDNSLHEPCLGTTARSSLLRRRIITASDAQDKSKHRQYSASRTLLMFSPFPRHQSDLNSKKIFSAATPHLHLKKQFDSRAWLCYTFNVQPDGCAQIQKYQHYKVLLYNMSVNAAEDAFFARRQAHGLCLLFCFKQ